MIRHYSSPWHLQEVVNGLSIERKSSFSIESTTGFTFVSCVCVGGKGMRTGGIMFYEQT
jgi:hypothetical protein